MLRPAPRWRLASAALAPALLFAASHCDLAVGLSGLEGGCPPAKHGAVQVKITTGPAPFCIDTTEVTNAQYAEFVRSQFTIAQAAAPSHVCDTLAGTTLSTTPEPGEDDFPVTNVNWCQAYAYCAWAGKRLCGQIGGGALAVLNAEKPAASQWLNACSAGGALAYPYGKHYSTGVCFGGGGPGSPGPENVASLSGCVGSVAGLFDMTGNVWEWTDCCADTTANGFCDTMGGAFDSTPTELACGTNNGATNGERNWARNGTANNIGFRCCMDL